jgi:hypothetical protein
MVTIKTKEATKYSKAIINPPKSIQIIFPSIFMGFVYD